MSCGGFISSQTKSNIENDLEIIFPQTSTELVGGQTFRITIMLKDDLIKKLRAKQSKMIQEQTKSVSFSAVIDDVLRTCMKNKVI